MNYKVIVLILLDVTKQSKKISGVNMLARVTNANIRTETKTITIEPDASMFVKVLQSSPNPRRAAIYIHGGGNGGNHTLIERPSRHLIDKGFLLPGDGVPQPERDGHFRLPAQFDRKVCAPAGCLLH